MKLTPIASNMTEVKKADGTRILYSYSTPVAGWDNKGPFRTDQYFSKTTSRHINKWLDGATARVVSQAYINSIIA